MTLVKLRRPYPWRGEERPIGKIIPVPYAAAVNMERDGTATIVDGKTDRRRDYERQDVLPAFCESRQP